MSDGWKVSPTFGRLCSLHIDIIEHSIEPLIILSLQHLLVTVVFSTGRPVVLPAGSHQRWLVLLVADQRIDAQVLRREEWLQLLQKHQGQSYLVLFGKFLDGNGLDLLYVQMHIFLWLQYAIVIREQVVQELCQEQGGPFIFLFGYVELFLQVRVVALQRVILLLLGNQTFLVLL